MWVDCQCATVEGGRQCLCVYGFAEEWVSARLIGGQVDRISFRSFSNL